MSHSSSLASLLLLITSAIASPVPQCGGHSVWDICVDEGPAPSPQDGPPLSAHAIRDKSKLKYEVIGIVGAYLAWLVVALFLIFVVGKRLRRGAQTSNRSLSMEMIKSATMRQEQSNVSPGPLSPGKMASLKAWAGSRGHSHKQSDITVSTINEKQVEMDRQRNMDEMTRLYAAVMVHDEERSQKTRYSGHASPESPRSPQNYSRPTQREPTPPMSPQYPPEFQHLRNAVAQAQTNAYGMSHSMAPTQPEDPYSTTTSRASTRVKASPLSFISTNKSDSRSRQGHVSVRDMPISQPIGSADLSNASQYSEEAPLSPRLYNPGPPPPTPGQKSAAAQAREIDAIRPQKHTPAALSLSGQTMHNNSSGSLPFRQMYQESMKSAPATKTTFLDKKEINMGTHPQTGVPRTPYSPYTPFTPMTPITPRTLMSRKDMKRQKKEKGLKVLSEDDMVKSDEDTWGA